MDDNITTFVGESVTGTGNITLDEQGLKAPKNILLTVSAAKQYYQNFRETHRQRIGLYAAIKGLIGGNSPYDAEKLAKAGLSHIANVNTLDAKGHYEKAALTFWNLVNQAANLVRFTIRPFGVSRDAEFSKWAEILSRNFTKVIKEDWEDFVPQMNTLTGQLVMFGLSPCVWSDEEDPRWSTVDLSRFFVADDTPVTTSKWDCVCVETVFTMQELYKAYTQVGDGGPWSKDGLAQLLLSKANSAMKSRGQQEYTNALDFQRGLEDGSFNQGMIFTDSIRLVSVLKKEYSGKISHYIFDNAGSSTEFLFEASEVYNEFSEALIVFTYSPGEFTLHANRGVGHKLFPSCQALMHLDNAMLDMAKLSSTPIIKTNSTVGRNMDPIRVIPGVLTDVGQAEVVQNLLGANIGQLVQLASYVENKITKNATISGDDPTVPDVDRGSKSAPEAQMQAVKEFGVGKQNVAHFYNTLDRVFRTMVAKMLHSKEGMSGYELAEHWKELCADEGVPPEVFEVKNSERHELPKHLSVRATRVAGDGSHLGLMMGLNSVRAIAGGFGAKGQRNLQEDIIISSLGIDYVDRYLSDSGRPDESAGGASLAQVENVIMTMGQKPMFSPDNQQKTHINVHMNLIQETIKEVQAKQLDPIEADGRFALMIEHLEMHIEQVELDPLNAAFIEEIKAPWRQIKKFAQVNRFQAQKMMQAETMRRAKEEQQMTVDMMEQDRKDKIAERDEARKDFKVRSQVERAKEANSTRAEVAKETARRKADNDRLAVELKAETDRIKTPQELLADRSTEDLQSTLRQQVGGTPNPADFE